MITEQFSVFYNAVIVSYFRKQTWVGLENYVILLFLFVYFINQDILCDIRLKCNNNVLWLTVS